MKDFFKKFLRTKPGITQKPADDQLKRQVASLYGLYSGIVGSEKVVLRAGKLDALEFMRSENLPERVLALQKLVFEDPTVTHLPSQEEMPGILDEIERRISGYVSSPGCRGKN